MLLTILTSDLVEFDSAHVIEHLRTKTFVSLATADKAAVLRTRCLCIRACRTSWQSVRSSSRAWRRASATRPRAIKLRLERRKALQDLKTRLAADVKAVRERVDQEEASLNKSPKKVISKAKSEAKAKHEAEFVEFR